MPTTWLKPTESAAAQSSTARAIAEDCVTSASRPGAGGMWLSVAFSPIAGTAMPKDPCPSARTPAPAAMAAQGILDTAVVYQRMVLSAICFHAYQQVSYMILQRVSPVTHSIGNCVKRVVVIASSILVFRNPVTQQNLLGTAIALAGVFAYSQVKRMKPKPPAAS